MEYSKVSKEIFDPIMVNKAKFEEKFGNQLAELFPSAVKDGVVDFASLLAELGQYIDTEERYELNWAGKSEAKRVANSDIVGKTLKYVPEDSKNPDTTQNLYIEGDNLEVLQLLRNNYYNSIKMIYIDPPYNTGSDFVYKDNFTQTPNEQAQAEGDLDQYGNRLIANQRSNGRFHSNWLSMLYPRLKVAKELLTDDGVIFVQIDDNELHNLIQIMNEIFGEDNYIGNVIWQHSIQPKGYLGKLSVHHNYLLIYSKNPSFSLGSLDRTEEHNKAYSNPDNDPNGPWRTGDVRNALYRPNLIYDIITPSGKVIKPPQNGWRWSKETVQAKISTGEIIFNKDETNIIRKIYLNSLEGRAPETIWFGKEVGTTRDANKTIKELFENEVPFDTPKPVELLKRVLQLSTLNNSNDIILDFFSGSATTAHAVMQFNAEGEVIGNRRFIMVQLPEVCHENSSAYNLGYKNICEIGKERIRRAGDKIKEEFKDKPGIENLDIGFKVFKVANTNIRWFSEAIKSNILDYDMTMTDKDKLDFNPGFTDIDVVYEILLRHRDIPLTTNVEQLTNIGNRTYIFADTVVVCLEETITEEMINKITAIEPMPTKIIFRDSAFGEDISLKENTMIRLEAQMRKNSGLEKRAYRVEFI